MIFHNSLYNHSMNVPKISIITLYYNKKMYTEDQSQTKTKNTLKTQQYELNTSITGTTIQIHLKSPATHKQYHRYSTSISLSDLEVSLHDKFEDLKNLQVFLCDRNNISVDLSTGVIQLIISISLLNGKSITTKLGQIRLKEDIFDSEKCLEHILETCDQVESFNQNSYRNVVRGLANMMKVLFKKMEIIQENLNQSDREAFYSFKSNSGKNLRFNSTPGEKTPKTQKGLTERLKENQQCQFNQLSQKQLGNRFKTFCTKQQLQILKKQITSKINTITQRQQKQELQTSILDIKVQQIKNQLKLETELLKKSLENNKENGHVLSRVQGACENNFFMIRSVQSEGVSPRSKQMSFENNLIQSSVVDADFKILRTQFEDFSGAVITKIENLGKANQLLEDKLKRIVSELDIRLEQKILQDSIEQIKTKIIDIQSPYFNQFNLNGTNIEYKGQDSISTMLLGKIKLTQKCKFSVKIVKTLVSNIQIGIIDADHRNKRDCWSVENFILYVGWNSTIYEGPSDMLHKEGNPIAEGDIVTLRANLQTGLIEWLVGGEVRAKVVWQKLKDKSINWVPMVRFYDHGDIIAWMTDKMLRI